MAGVYGAIRIFALEHKGCGDLRGDAEPLTPEGLRGVGVVQVWAADAEADLLRSALPAFENYALRALRSLPLRPRRDCALVSQCSFWSRVYGARVATVDVAGLAARAVHAVHSLFECVEVVGASLAILPGHEPGLRHARNAPQIRAGWRLYPQCPYALRGGGRGKGEEAG